MSSTTANRVPHSAENVREIADQVLSDPAYTGSDRQLVLSEGLEGQLRNAFNKLKVWWDSVTQSLQDLSVSQPFLFWCLMGVLVLVLALLLWHIGYSFSLLFRGHRRGDAGRRQTTSQQTLRFESLWDDAHRLAQAGNYTEGIRHLLLALLARSDDQRLTLPPGWTNLEIARSLSAQDVGKPLTDFVTTFDRLWYGREDAEEADFRRCQDLTSACLERLRNPPT